MAAVVQRSLLWCCRQPSDAVCIAIKWGCLASSTQLHGVGSWAFEANHAQNSSLSASVLDGVTFAGLQLPLQMLACVCLHVSLAVVN
jgi:hypothetical protein